jgi:N-acetyl-anhydromuramyl-L-alanine amidase AmpD
MNTPYRPITPQQEIRLVELAADIASRYGIPTDSIRSKAEVDPRRHYEITDRMRMVRQKIDAARRAPGSAGSPGARP